MAGAGLDEGLLARIEFVEASDLARWTRLAEMYTCIMFCVENALFVSAVCCMYILYVDVM